MKANQATTVDKNGRSWFQHLDDGPCEVCGLDRCLPDHPHGPGMVYHVEAGRFLLWPQVEEMNGTKWQQSDLSTMPTDRKTLAEYETGIKARQEERRRKTRERNRRYRREGRQRHVLNPQKSDL